MLFVFSLSLSHRVPSKFLVPQRKIFELHRNLFSSSSGCGKIREKNDAFDAMKLEGTSKRSIEHLQT